MNTITRYANNGRIATADLDPLILSKMGSNNITRRYMVDEVSNLVELVEMLRSIDVSPENTEKNEYTLYDKDGNKIIL